MKLKDNKKIEEQAFSTIEKPETSLKRLNSHGKKDFEEDLYKNVLYQLEERKIYLMPDLSLIKFSQIVGTNTSYLSKVVSLRFGSNFRTLVNRYRVAYAIELMQNIGEGCSIDEVLRRSGFVSRSVFYDAFLKAMGKPPSKYLEEKMRE